MLFFRNQPLLFCHTHNGNGIRIGPTFTAGDLQGVLPGRQGKLNRMAAFPIQGEAPLLREIPHFDFVPLEFGVVRFDLDIVDVPIKK